MSNEKKNRLSEVFGTSRDVPLTYVERPVVDDRFLNDITRDKHIVVHGASKQGKTCLRKHHLGDDDCIVLQCTRDTSKPALYEQLLKRAGIKCDVSESTTLSGARKLHVEVGVQGGIPMIAKGDATGGIETDSGQHTQTSVTDFEIDPSDANDIVRVLERANFRKFIIVEDFHYLDEDVQQSLAFDLKVFHDTSELTFVIVGVWLEANKLTLYNGDLSGRVATINADEWSEKQLAEVVTSGAALLNIALSEGVCDKIVAGCKSNVGLLQEVCYRLCELHGVFATQDETKFIDSADEVDAMLRAVAEEQAARYRNFLARFSEGLGDSKLEMYKWIGFAAVSSTSEGNPPSG